MELVSISVLNDKERKLLETVMRRIISNLETSRLECNIYTLNENFYKAKQRACDAINKMKASVKDSKDYEMAMHDCQIAIKRMDVINRMSIKNEKMANALLTAGWMQFKEEYPEYIIEATRYVHESEEMSGIALYDYIINSLNDEEYFDFDTIKKEIEELGIMKGWRFNVNNRTI